MRTFFVDMYSGHCLSSAYSKLDSAKPRMDSSVLYIPIATPGPCTPRRRRTSACHGSVLRRSVSPGINDAAALQLASLCAELKTVCLPQPVHIQRSLCHHVAAPAAVPSRWKRCVPCSAHTEVVRVEKLVNHAH